MQFLNWPRRDVGTEKKSLTNLYNKSLNLLGVFWIKEPSLFFVLIIIYRIGVSILGVRNSIGGAYLTFKSLSGWLETSVVDSWPISGYIFFLQLELFFITTAVPCRGSERIEIFTATSTDHKGPVLEIGSEQQAGKFNATQLEKHVPLRLSSIFDDTNSFGKNA